MEGLTLNLFPLVSFVVLFIIEFLLFHVLNRVGGFKKLLSRYQSFIEFRLGFSQDLKTEVSKNQQECDFRKQSVCFSTDKSEDEVIRREDIEIVMEKLGLFCTPKNEKLKEGLESNEISNLFEEREPSLGELKVAFDIFDENKDGFIDVEELSRILRILGLKEGLNMQNCTMMIGVFDQNGDNRIDFNEFVQVMENGFC